VLSPFFFSFVTLCIFLELAPLLELAPYPSGALLHALLELCSMPAMPTLSWHWPSPPGACAGLAHLELVLAVFFSLTVMLGLFSSLY
jgi:hypothetical protein